jgi:hypothetical protein
VPAVIGLTGSMTRAAHPEQVPHSNFPRVAMQRLCILSTSRHNDGVLAISLVATNSGTASEVAWYDFYQGCRREAS